MVMLLLLVWYCGHDGDNGCSDDDTDHCNLDEDHDAFGGRKDEISQKFMECSARILIYNFVLLFCVIILFSHIHLSYSQILLEVSENGTSKSSNVKIVFFFHGEPSHQWGKPPLMDQQRRVLAVCMGVSGRSIRRLRAAELLLKSCVLSGNLD